MNRTGGNRRCAPRAGWRRLHRDATRENARDIASAAAFRGDAMKILVVDDHPLIVAGARALPAADRPAARGPGRGQPRPDADRAGATSRLRAGAARPRAAGRARPRSARRASQRLSANCPSSCCRRRTIARPSARRSRRARAGTSPRPPARRPCSTPCARCSAGGHNVTAAVSHHRDVRDARHSARRRSGSRSGRRKCCSCWCRASRTS